MTQKERVLNSLLSSRRPIAASTFANRLGTSTSRVRFIISELRNEGYQIYADRRQNPRPGSSKFVYSF